MTNNLDTRIIRLANSSANPTEVELASNSADMEDEVLCKLKLSYDYLRNGKLKSCFLYCSLYPEDYPIKIEELIDVWIGEGFLNEVCDRLEGRDVVECLKNACLLESCVIEEYGLVEHGVKMHDVIRELAIWVASSGLGEINVKDSIQEQQDLHKWEFAERISLTGSKAVSKLTGAPKCRNLLTLLLRGSEIRTLSDEFFQYMPRLKVLSMPQHLEIDNLPASISSLSGLHYLNLAKTSFSSNATLKPGTFDSLVSLKTLDLYFSNLRNWEKKGGPSLDELERLENLKSLGLTIESDVALKKLVTTVKLQMCTKKLMVEIERGISSISLSPSSPLSPTSVSLANMAGLKILHLRQCSGLRELRIPSTSSVCAEDKVTLCTSLEVLHIQLVAQLDIVCDMLQQSSCFVNLKHVRIMGCHELKDVSWLIYAQNLEILDMGYQNILEEIISYRFPGVTDCDITFRRLQTMKLYELGNLQRICNHNVKFPVLKHITVMYCPKLKKLPFDPRTLRKIEGQKEWWESLVWEDETAKSILTPFFVISKG
ncbi:hypothetical protein C5167_009744 [Papaver somniferum]|uniref:NB-ARC domain-containing protein n=1 Tax=Papaver somniferum TaxID=3469 RepID=A0A4Y7K2B0_PAPSO|nr:hypothetical protein C5167_009744 [Papaver somniferum]